MTHFSIANLMVTLKIQIGLAFREVQIGIDQLFQSNWGKKCSKLAKLKVLKQFKRTGENIRIYSYFHSLNFHVELKFNSQLATLGTS